MTDCTCPRDLRTLVSAAVEGSLDCLVHEIQPTPQSSQLALNDDDGLTRSIADAIGAPLTQRTTL